MSDYNSDIIYVRLYGGSLVPITRASIVTVSPNDGEVEQEIPLEDCIKRLMHYNLNNFQKLKNDWHELDNYDILQKAHEKQNS